MWRHSLTRSDYLLEPAFKTGKLTIVDNAVAGQVLVDDKGLANGVRYFDRQTKEERKVYAKRVVVAASCIDSTRIVVELQIHQVSERNREFERRDRPIPDRAGSVPHAWLRSGVDWIEGAER